MRSNRPGPRRFKPQPPRPKPPRIMDGVKPNMAADYKLAFYNEDNKLFYLSSMWRKENSTVVLNGRTATHPYLDKAIRELVRAFKAKEDVRFIIFKTDARKDGSRDSSRGRQDGPKGSGFRDEPEDDGMDMGDVPDSNVGGDVEPDSDLPF